MELARFIAMECGIDPDDKDPEEIMRFATYRMEKEKMTMGGKK